MRFTKTGLFQLLLLLLHTGCNEQVPNSTLIHRAQELLKSHPDSARLLLDSISMPNQLNGREHAHWCMLSGQIDDTLHTNLPYAFQLKRAQKYYTSKGTPQQQAQIALYLGRAYVDDNEHDKAMQTYLAALAIALTAKDYNRAGYICSEMGDLYLFEDNYLPGKDKYEEGSRYFKQAGNLKCYALALRDVGKAYVFADSCQAGLHVIHKADSIAKEIKDSSAIASIQNGLGNTYSALGNLSLAKAYLWQALKYGTKDKAPNYLALADVYTELQQYDSARICLEWADIPTFTQDVPIGIAYGHYKIEKAANNAPLALAYLEKATAGLDSIREIQRYTNLVDTEKRHNQLQVLMENAGLRARVQRYIIISLLLALGCLVLFVIYQTRINRKDKELLARQKEIEEKRQMHLRLQRELLAKKSELQSMRHQLLEKESQHIDITDALTSQYEQKRQEVEELVCALQLQQQTQLMASPIAKKVLKLSKTVVAGAETSPLTKADWQILIDKVNEVFPNFPGRISGVELGDAEIAYCYLSLLRLDISAEAILLNIAPDSVRKRQQRVRQKFGIIGKNYDLPDYIVGFSRE